MNPQRQRLHNILLLTFSLFLTVVLGEVILRIAGKTPGYVPIYKRFRPVDSLVVSNSFIADSEGVFIANPKFNRSIPINNSGFRGADFDSVAKITSKPKILFLGDSFTWGNSASPLDSCFVDLVRLSGFATFNTGIPGTGPTQYAHLAERYIPRIKPDFVAVMFFMGNDIRAEAPMKPHQRRFHVTNAGWLNAFDRQGQYMEAEKAYQYYVNQSNLVGTIYKPSSLKSHVQRQVMKTVLGTYLWGALSKLKRIVRKNPADSNPIGGGSGKSAFVGTRRSLARIQKACKVAGAKYLLFLIPAPPGKRSKYTNIADNKDVFEGFSPWIPDFLLEDDYTDLPDGHFTNAGHRKYANFILQVVQGHSLREPSWQIQ